MTEVISKPEGAEREGVKRISHWIGGKIVAGESGRSGPVYNPAAGQQTGEVDFASVEEVDAGSRDGRGGVPGLARVVALATHGALLPHPRARRTSGARTWPPS